ncbi:MAG: vWA domain-containing protein, partial [Planctomycetota bacterium]
HTELVAGRKFKFPPRCQPMHAARRSVIAAMDIVKQRNGVIPNKAYRDRVAVITFDSTDGSQVRHGLTNTYVNTMKSVARLQAVGDKGTTTATESGLILAKQLLRRKKDGGEARDDAKRVVVLLTDGMPNAYETSETAINKFASSSVIPDSYGGGYFWLDAALMQTNALEVEGIDVYPVGIGLGADYDFMDRAARTGGTGGKSGTSPRGSGNPNEYEAILTDIFRKIVSLPTARLVE